MQFVRRAAAAGIHRPAAGSRPVAGGPTPARVRVALGRPDTLYDMIDSRAGLDDAGVAVAAAHAGADVVRNMYGQRLTRIDKGAGDFATAADVEAEKAILDVIRAARPDDAVLGAEGGQRGAADAVRRWLVDPLCGTLNYAVGTMLVAVNVALRNGAAAVADPFSAEVFFTDGKTAWVRHGGVDGGPIGRGRGLVAACDAETHGRLMSMIRRRR